MTARSDEGHVLQDSRNGGSGLPADGLAVTRLRAGTRTHDLVHDVSFTAPRGSITALIGPNGAGKTSTVRALIGALPRVRGEVALDGVVVSRLRRRERARRIALVEQDAAPTVDLDVRQVVELGRIPHRSRYGASDDVAVVDAALAESGVERFASRRFGTLSGGERQRVHLARALAQQPGLLVLDEPTNHLDLRAQLDTLQLLRRRADAGMAVLAALHDLNLVAMFCDRVVVMVDGRAVAEGPVEEILDPALLHAVYGVDIVRIPHPESGRPLLAFRSEQNASAPSTSGAEIRL